MFKPQRIHQFENKTPLSLPNKPAYMRDDPSVRVNGRTRTVSNDSEVLDVFEQHAGFGIGDQVEELIVDTIDAELDYNTKHEHHVLRCYVYFKPLETVNMGSVQEENITVDGWERDGQMVGDGRICIIYENAL